ncbi:YWTD domain-containing protein [Aulographum hederae CBS 113979]|uniref:YWTD domain-containing protein n=1 Tax=Aulographum hederae CBS 113979 TaxID=1176131 RepID=A0A6G1H586_9PEZI|nr:YWTD domain-containing protein [Aulographum hederae CBS 113979]
MPSLRSIRLGFVSALAVLQTAVVAAPVSSATSAAGPRIYFLDILGSILSVNPDGSDLQTVLNGLKSGPDGIVVDKANNHIYFSQMGNTIQANGLIQRVNMDGTGLITLVGDGKTHTPKQVTLASIDGVRKIYWGDREGMAVMRANLDGTDVETLVRTGTGRPDPIKEVVGVAVDEKNKIIYWTQKGNSDAGQGTLHRTNLAANIGVLATTESSAATQVMTALPEPIDLKYMPETETLYWTDRGNLPTGNSVNDMTIAAGNGTSRIVMGEKRTLIPDIGEAIGIAIDSAGKRMYSTSLDGMLYSSNLDGSDLKTIKSGLGPLTGVDFVP